MHKHGKAGLPDRLLLLPYLGQRVAVTGRVTRFPPFSRRRPNVMPAVLLSGRVRLDSEWLLCRKLGGRSGSTLASRRPAQCGQERTFDIAA